MDSTTLTGSLHQLARLYNVQTAYYDTTHRRRQASPESLLSVLKALGAPVASLADTPSALRERKQAIFRRIIEPVTVAWNGECPVIRVCVPAGAADAPWHGSLDLEDNRRMTWEWQAADLPVLESADIEGTRYLVKGITLPETLPHGYHSFSLETGGTTGETLIIAAPVRTYLPPGDAGERMWGAFLPLYALYTGNSRGSGSYADLEALADWVSSLGGEVIATLPLLPTFLDEPFEPSPYAPVSRLVWNEFYIDLDKVPELAASPRARELLDSLPFAAGHGESQAMPDVDYRRVMAGKRRVLEECCRCLVAEKPGRYSDFRRFIQDSPVVEDYAGFRATMEKRHAPWRAWPLPDCDGTLSKDAYDEGVRDYHQYAQWLAHGQVRGLSEKSRRKGTILYFDLPLGAHPDGYDAWRQSSIFSPAMSTGAPPDAVFTRGQDWGFPPLQPEKIREQGYRYVIDYLRHHLQHAGMLRIDHVMGLHRLFWIPGGGEASHGVYVRYRAEEMYAILALESQRYRSIIVGEDLGTVPPYVRPAMSRHDIQRMYVLHYELADDSGRLRHPLHNTVASLNTHDMPPFAAFWQGLDIRERREAGWLDSKGVKRETRARRSCKDILAGFLHHKHLLRDGDDDTGDIIRACLFFLGGSRARTVLVNLEDLWQETRSQNVPGTNNEHPNWRRRARYALEEFCRMPEVRDTLKEIHRLRKRG